MTGTHVSVAMATAIYSQTLFGSPPTFTYEGLCHNLSQRQTLLTSALCFSFVFVATFALFPYNKPHMELYWPGVACLDVSLDSNTTVIDLGFFFLPTTRGYRSE